MGAITLFDQGDHRNLLLSEKDAGDAVPTNHHVIIHGGAGMVLDPGGHKVYRHVLGDTTQALRGGQLRMTSLSHQDPDIVASLNGWLMTTDAEAYASELWVRFIPHFGIDRLVQGRLHGVPDRGQVLDLGGCELLALPAHFLHSCGNLHLYDPVSKILYSGDLGASIGESEREIESVEAFAAHIPLLEGFHRRYMASNRSLQAWARMVRRLDIETIAPQHGAMLRGPAVVEAFIGWCEGLACGIDLLDDVYQLPTREDGDGARARDRG